MPTHTDQQEESRVAALHALKILDTPREERYDRVVRIAREVFQVSGAAVNLLDTERQFTKAEAGLPGLVHVARTDSPCHHTVTRDAPLIVPDATADELLRTNPFVTATPPVRFYAGHPLHAPGGETVGSLCLVDGEPRQMSEREQRLLAEMAGWVEREFAAQCELDRAEEIQQMLMPKTDPALDGWEIAGQCTAASSIGGDFYDWFRTGDSLQMTLADVMGKGIPAALLSASVRAVLRGTFQYNEPSEAITRASGALDPLLDEAGAFVTVFTARLSSRTGVLEYVDAGHGLAVVLRPDGTRRRLETSGPPLGAVPGVRWRIHSTLLVPGETLLVVSDGFLDYFTDIDEAVEVATAANARAATAAELVERCAGYARSAGLDDDSTVLALRRTA
ncbi:PP2C family protein-serine/threonine phosphatase [Kocuria sp. CPCC 205300]|uniref:PP2C family protein-serine/threonine phosphatase n=1 Tax=Kocuria sabuli TaxID=3071448 RepID=UPI0036D91377